MSRSLLVLLSSCALVALLLAPTSATAQGFTEADLVGDYGFEAAVESDNSTTVASGRGLIRFVGHFSADGLGGVTGSRSLSREVDSTSGLIHLIEVVEQDFVGTYSIEPDGTGIMTIEPTPNPDWVRERRSMATEFESAETLHLVLADGGRQLLINLTIAGRLFQTSTGQEFGRIAHSLSGHALAQEPSTPEPDPRIDVLTDLVASQAELLARQSAQLCEVLRLLNTPQGQRETSTPEVLDACGTAYEWNGEGTGGPR